MSVPTELRDLYQEVILDHNRHPRNFRAMPDADRRAEGHNPLCGDRVTVYLDIEDGVVKDVTFEGSGCAISTASASVMTEVVKGKTVEEARGLFEKFHCLITGCNDEPASCGLRSALGKLVVFSGVCAYPGRVKCAALPWHTLNAALAGSSDKVSTEG